MTRGFKREMQVKRGAAWETTYTNADDADIIKALSVDMAAHYIGKAQYVKTIKRHNNFDGTQTYTTYYNNGTRCVYLVSLY